MLNAIRPYTAQYNNTRQVVRQQTARVTFSSKAENDDTSKPASIHNVEKVLIALIGLASCALVGGISYDMGAKNANNNAIKEMNAITETVESQAKRMINPEIKDFNDDGYQDFSYVDSKTGEKMIFDIARNRQHQILPDGRVTEERVILDGIEPYQ